ncbi:DUF6090 family protein [Rhodohalobacter mucosus]|uniref:Uncharacterized protein n=1 Tax=Rhodohalobacter mucosus TaxID=2079485 RepID=A0A316TXF4_9BACT|nr:DUF6090 family protein [Rhodohalobacter mucosus]PWN07294.1 hypothetical protein DDZ15_03230 [Rhodohalobacter mucosus]
MEQNKVRTYIFYAIGEILLVVIGILIALQVNNWNVERQNTVNEEFYLEKIEASLRSDSLRLIQTIDLGNTMLAMIDSAEIMMDAPEAYEAVNFRAKLLALAWQNEFRASRSVFDNLNATGEIKLLKDQSFVDDLYIYYNTGTDIGMKEYARREITPYLMRFDEIRYEDFGNLSIPIPELNNYRLEGRPIEDYRNDAYINNALKLKRVQIINQNAAFYRLLDLINGAMKKLNDR